MKKALSKLIAKKLKISEKISSGVDQRLSSHGLVPIKKRFPEDIYIAGYPKSGNTWMQNLIAGVMYCMSTSYLPDKLTQELVPDVHAKNYYTRFSSPTFFKTHDHPQPYMKNVIHLVRDGRDVMASYYAMNVSLGVNTTLEKMIIDGKDIYPGKWSNHTKQWLDNPFEAKILTVRYEDLIADASTEIEKILEFFNIQRSREIIERSVLGNSFDEMQRKESDFGWYNQKWKKDEKFIRKGKIGSHKSEIPQDLIEYFENEAHNELSYYKYL